MSISLMIYLITLADSLRQFAMVIIVISTIIIVVGIIILPLVIMEYPSVKDSIAAVLYKLRYFLISILITSCIVNVAIPEKNDMYIILGLSVAERVITSDKGNELFDKSYQLVIDKIDEATMNKNKEEDSK